MMGEGTLQWALQWVKGLDGGYVYNPEVPWRTHTVFVKADISQYVRCWENHIRDDTQRREERIREERQSGEHGDDNGTQSDDDDNDKDGRTDGKEVEEHNMNSATVARIYGM